MSKPIQRCVICGGTRFRKVTGRANWEVHTCQTCTNAFTFPFPTTDHQYEDNTFFDIPIEQEHRWRKGAAEIVQFIRAAGCQGDFLDVGFGSGLVLQEASAAGFRARGIEASRPAVLAAQSRGLDVRQGYLQENTFPANTFDVIVMSHVLEHVADPHNLLVTASNLLRPCGYLFLSQTNYLGTLPRLLGPRWYAWVPSEHFTHFSPRGISYLLQSGGLQIKALKITTLFWDWVSIIKTPLQLLPGTILHNIAALINQTRVGFPFAGDNMFILAQKAQRT